MVQKYEVSLYVCRLVFFHNFLGGRPQAFYHSKYFRRKIVKVINKKDKKIIEISL